MEPTIKRSLWPSFGLALMASVTAHFLAFFLFTIHEAGSPYQNIFALLRFSSISPAVVTGLTAHLGTLS